MLQPLDKATVQMHAGVAGPVHGTSSGWHTAYHGTVRHAAHAAHGNGAQAGRCMFPSLPHTDTAACLLTISHMSMQLKQVFLAANKSRLRETISTTPSKLLEKAACPASLEQARWVGGGTSRHVCMNTCMLGELTRWYTQAELATGRA